MCNVQDGPVLSIIHNPENNTLGIFSFFFFFLNWYIWYIWYIDSENLYFILILKKKMLRF